MELKEILNICYDILIFAWLIIFYAVEAFIIKLIPRRYQSKSIQGEVALITGSASGIGRLIAIKLAALGAHVIIWDINEQGIRDVEEEIRSNGGKCTGYVCDIADKNEIYKVVKTMKIEIGNVTIIVNNAGYVYGKTFMDLPDDEIEKTFKVNILSHYWINKSFLSEMMKENHGHIVTIASITGLIGTYNCTDYSATKFAAVGYHESLFTELKVHGYHGIHATLVCPYLINTGMFPGLKPRMMAALEAEYVAQEIVCGILTNQTNITIPSYVIYFLPLKNWMPTKLLWALMYNIVQGPQTMMMLRKNENNSKHCNGRNFS